MLNMKWFKNWQENAMLHNNINKGKLSSSWRMNYGNSLPLKETTTNCFLNIVLLYLKWTNHKRIYQSLLFYSWVRWVHASLCGVSTFKELMANKTNFGSQKSYFFARASRMLFDHKNLHAPSTPKHLVWHKISDFFELVCYFFLNLLFISQTWSTQSNLANVLKIRFWTKLIWFRELKDQMSTNKS